MGGGETREGAEKWGGEGDTWPGWLRGRGQNAQEGHVLQQVGQHARGQLLKGCRLGGRAGGGVREEQAGESGE